MIEVQMSVDDYCDLFSAVSRFLFESFAERMATINPIHLDEFFRPLLANARLNQNLLLARINKDAVHVHANAVVLVWWAHSRPKRSWDHSKHRSSIEMEFGVWNDLHPVVAYLHAKLTLL